MNGEVQQGRTRMRLVRRYLLGGLAVLLLSSAAWLPGVSTKQAHADTVTFVFETLGTPSSATLPAPVSTGFLGVNIPQYVPAWLGTNDAGTPAPSLAATLQLSSLRFPGGSNADYYQWEANAGDPTPNFNPFHDYQNYVDPNMNFDAFMNQVSQLTTDEGFRPGTANTPLNNTDITVNYGSGTAAEAASWVAYANKNMVGYSSSVPKPSYAGASATGHAYGIKYWEIGNEDYGDGTYATSTNAAHWEYDTTPGPAAYGRAVVSYSSAMKAVDSTIQVGALLTAYGNFPDGATSATSPQPWNTTVLSTPGVCNAINFVALHWYAQQPGAESDAGLLAAPTAGISGNTPNIQAIVAQTKAELQQYCPGKTIAIRVTEANSVNSSPGKQTVSPVNALFLENTIADLYEQGVQGVNWWGFVNGFYQYPDEIPPGNTFPFNPGNLSSSLYGSAAYGDYGLLSDGSSYVADAAGDTVSEPDQLTPFPSYYGMELVDRFLGTGLANSVVPVTNTNSGAIQTYAVQRGNFIEILLLNNTSNLIDVPEITLPPGDTNQGSFVSSYLYSPTNGGTNVQLVETHPAEGGTQVGAPSALYPYGSEVVGITI